VLPLKHLGGQTDLRAPQAEEAKQAAVACSKNSGGRRKALPDQNSKSSSNAARLDGGMMRWVRTATCLISFGFTIYKFFQMEIGKRESGNYLIGPRGFAMMRATIQHVQDRNLLWAMNPDVPVP